MLSRNELLELVESYDETPCYLSVYGDPRKREDMYVIDRRIVDIRKALKGDRHLSTAFDQNLERAMELLKGSTGAAAVFLSVENSFERSYHLGVDIGPSLVVDSSPYLIPLLTYLEERETFIVLYIDENHARIITVEGGEITDVDSLKEDIFHHHKKGGWSQMRFQRRREVALHRFFKEIEEELRKVVDESDARRLVVAGPGITREFFIGKLPQDLARKVIGTFAVSGDASGSEMLEKATEVFFMEEALEEGEAVEALKAGVLKGEGVAYGIEETYRAVLEGRAELIVMSMGLEKAGWKCESCREVSFKTKACPMCGIDGIQVNVIEELAEVAIQMNTKLEFVKDSEELEELGGIGAFLRY